MSFSTGSNHLAFNAGTYAVTLAPSLTLLVCDTAAGPIVLNFSPSSATPLAAVEIKKKNLGTNTVTANGEVVNGAQDTFEGVVSYEISTANRGSVSLRSDGLGAWWAVPYALPLASDVVMLPAPAMPTVSATTGMTGATVTLGSGSTDSVGTFTVVGGTLSLNLSGTITVKFANPAVFGTVPPNVQVSAGNVTAGSAITTVSAACTNTSAMVVTLSSLALAVNGTAAFSYNAFGVAQN